ncbi:Ytp1p [Rhodotorula paludigena]|uniref:Ytp1p n=1 Tax=Rhodotorula paludigena TaxID=86838 RepID=UPI003171A5A3
MGARRLLCFALVLAAASLPRIVSAHEHHEVETGPYEHNFTNDEPLDGTIKWHIAIQIFCWGILFPAGMVLGITRSRFHVPLQSLTVALSLAGNSLGHHHGGRSFHMTAHAHFAGYLWWYMISQTAMGIFLKLHVLEGTVVRRSVVVAHGIVGKSFPVVGWTQMIFGGIAALGFCFNDHVGQCAAHFIMGSAFIAYAVILIMMMRVGAGFLRRKQMSQEYLDSWVIMLWGIVNTFTEHNFLSPHPTGWSHKDMQHVSLGVLWWAGGALGIWIGRNGKRNVVPAVIIGMTGYAMANHGQHLEFSTDIHRLFGWALMAAGLTRIIEICFVLRDEPTPAVEGTARPKAFQHLTPFLLVLSGLTFLSATEEQMAWIAGSGMDSTTYANILFSGSFAIYLVGVAMFDLYEYQTRHKTTAAAIGLVPTDADVEGAAAADSFNDEDSEPYRPASLMRSDSPPPLRVLGFALPTFLASAADFARRLEARGRRGDPSSSSRSAGGRRGHVRRETEEYESLPLTQGRESADVRQEDILADAGAANEALEMQARRQGGAGRTGPGSDDTVFELGQYEDDGGDAYWEEKEVDAGRRG